MNKRETVKIMAVLKAAYPNYYKGQSVGELNAVADLWQEMFADDAYELVALAVKSFIAGDDKGFPPVIGVIKDYISKITHPDEMCETEAWAIIRAALCNCAYGYRQEWEKLPELLRSMTSPGQLREWALMDSETVGSVVASNFMRSYRARAKNEREYRRLPAEVRAMMSGIAAKMALPCGFDGAGGD